jgi:hypothetical protein
MLPWGNPEDLNGALRQGGGLRGETTCLAQSEQNCGKNDSLHRELQTAVEG